MEAGRGHDLNLAAGSGPACRAPFVAMEFDPYGDVQACCANSLHPLGNVTRSSLREIWDGAPARSLREAVQRGDYDLGCHICRFRLTHGHGDLAQEYYDHFPMPGAEAEWPFSLQFSLHNTCNLACVMCGGERSSMIRSRRDRLPPLPRVYGDAFFEQVEPFLAHAGAVDLSGGEPFLIAEHGRIWDLLIDLDPAQRPLCSLTTNGTVWNARTERVLDQLSTHVAVSIDGMTKATFESIRLGASHGDVFANLDRFADHTRERGTKLTMSWSLVRQNWFELGAAARFAEEKGIDLKVLTVLEPEYGVQRLPTEDLELVVRSLEEEDRYLAPDLDRNLDAWRREIGRLRDELALRSGTRRRPVSMEPPQPGNRTRALAVLLDAARPVADDASLPGLVGAVEVDLDRWGQDLGRVEGRLDGDGVICELRPGIGLPLEAVDPAVGDGIGALLGAVEGAIDGALWLVEEVSHGPRLDQYLWVGRTFRDKVGLSLRLVTIRDQAGAWFVLVADPTLLRRTGEVPVRLGAGPSAR